MPLWSKRNCIMCKSGSINLPDAHRLAASGPYVTLQAVSASMHVTHKTVQDWCRRAGIEPLGRDLRNRPYYRLIELVPFFMRYSRQKKEPVQIWNASRFALGIELLSEETHLLFLARQLYQCVKQDRLEESRVYCQALHALLVPDQRDA